ncbi:MAG: autotransporter domain-containing protein, partial [Cetobacterium sp.]
MKNIKLLKVILKKRKDVTLPVLVLFLITGSIGYGVSIENKFVNEEVKKETVKFESSIESFNNMGSIISNGEGLFIKTALGDSLNENTIKNSGLIKSNRRGIFFNGSETIGVKEIKNTGAIMNETFGAIVATLTKDGKDILVENIDNNGILKSGDGIDLYSWGNTNLKNIENTGIILSKNSGINIFAANGTASIESLNNTGIIQGDYGIRLQNNAKNNPEKSIINNLTNAGIISGESAGVIIYGNNPSINRLINNGVISSQNNAIRLSQLYQTQEQGQANIYNSGVIKGNASTIQNSTNSGSVAGEVKYKNDGIFVGKNIFTGINGVKDGSGVEILIDSNGNVTNIENGIGGKVTLEDGTTKVVINGDIDGNDSYTISNGINYENNIINGAGITEGTLIVKGETSINNSIVNGYNTAVYLDDSSQLIATNTTFNGGGLANDIAVIKGSSGDNIANILEKSIINGTVDLGAGNDTLTIANTVQINGKLDGEAGDQDTLNLGEIQIAKATDSPNLNILHDINGFESINTKGNITLFETVNVTGAENITLESGNLVLRVDPTVTVDGKVTGHALFGNNGTLTSNGGNLVIGLNGLGEGAVVSMGETTITPETNDSWWKDTDHIKTNSLVLDGKLSADGKDINITVLESIPLEPSIPVLPIYPPVESPIVVDSFLYEKLNKVYQSIVTAGEIGNLANTTLLEDKTYNESLAGLLTILDQIYANNPYAYSLKSSRDSLKLFEDNLTYLTIKPKKDEMIVQGKAIYTGVKNDTSDSGKNYYGFDTGHRNYKTTTNTVGGLATFEYGLSDNTSVGFVFGGNNQDVKFKGSSKIKGNSLYLGTFAKTDIRNFKFMSGVGYQSTSADVDRKVSNRYDSFSTGDKYDINSLNAFIEAKYVYNAEQNWTVEPKVRLSYYYINQDKVNEEYTPGQISMKTDAVNSKTTDVEVGVDFVKSLYLNNGKLKNILSLGVINAIGDKSKELNGYIVGKEKDGKKFDIQGVELPKTSGKVSYNLELEQTNGMIYTAGVSLEFAKDYNR